MMLTAISAETFRMPNGRYHHLLKFFALICSLWPSRSRVRRLVSILSLGIHPLLCPTLRPLVCRTNGAHPLRARRATISYAYSATYTKRPAEHSTARAY